ncbi:MAG: DNA alkylation repair protein [Coriobacteriia bacterium]|nr:DNA alkylation repair protein [Coriobacteriia bacterium]
MDLIADIRRRLRANADPDAKESGERFFKEPIKMYGMKLTVARKIAKDALKAGRSANMTKAEVFALCEELWKSGMQEEAIIACVFSESQKKNFRPEDFEVFEHWVAEYVSNWATCDTLCNHTVGDLLMLFPELGEKLLLWTASENRWLRRAAAVTLIIPAKNGAFLPLVFKIADRLLLDMDDLVRKGYGWMLKEAAANYEDEVFTYVMENKAVMPRTALRYAIEKMPPERKKLAMAK